VRLSGHFIDKQGRITGLISLTALFLEFLMFGLSLNYASDVWSVSSLADPTQQDEAAVSEISPKDKGPSCVPLVQRLIDPSCRPPAGRT
jgi:hypothetical protein